MCIRDRNNLFPNIKSRFDYFNNNSNAVEESIKEYSTLLLDLEQELIQLKDTLRQTIERVNKTLELLRTSAEKELITMQNITPTAMNLYEEVKTAVEEENIPYIINKLDANISIGLSDNDINLAKGLKESVLRLSKAKELEAVRVLLKEFNEKYEEFVEKLNPSSVSKFVYGTCKALSYFKELCRYNIQTKKLVPVIPVPGKCSVLQINKRVFVSGGYEEKFMNTLSEYVEYKNALIPKEPMKYSKLCHAAQATSDKSFAVLGGSNDLIIPYCEEYSLAKNSWVELPPLNRSRWSAGSAFVGGRFLYAICGLNTDTIEMLDMSEKKAWKMMQPVLDALALETSPAAFAVSDSEIVILLGNNTEIVSAYDIKDDKIRVLKHTANADYYHYKSIVAIEGKVYTLSYNGNMHIYDIKKRALEEVPYEYIIP
eukprot:TRINITY_DN17042_c0_g1_i2.p1 TRINITY_DN17042_c0_g1~~TRINITY_DN17042_c0_g1_i2.p1  ORF type:complete len:428 (+),score=95.12 TRINITY_DN17042_c0_g1_i2:75-1358(+)